MNCMNTPKKKKIIKSPNPEEIKFSENENGTLRISNKNQSNFYFGLF